MWRSEKVKKWGLMLMAWGLLLAVCGEPQVPETYRNLGVLPKVYPDYVGVTVPPNMAPLHFELLNEADDAVVRFTSKRGELVCGGLKTRTDVAEWHALTAAARGDSITVEVFAHASGQWLRFKPFAIYVANDSIDPWMSYRLISPSYVSYEELTINQRCLENFDEDVMVDNMLCSTEAGGQCVNCHSFQQYNPQRMQFHARQSHGGTVIVYDGKAEKIDWNIPNLKSQTSNLKSQTSNLKSPPVYPSWHPSLPLIAYSTNKTLQSFHTAHPNKIEVLDTESHLTLYDIDSHTMTTVEQLPDELETFPCWSPDGRWLYFCSAHFKYQADSVSTEEIILRADELKYNIYRKPFDPDTRCFGERELVFAADSLGLSAALPRISPDGRWLLFTVAQSGTFHIWHHDADLWMMDLHSLEAHPMADANSDDTESYHSWSSNGHWVVFSSRRYDGVFTRPFFTHIDKDGHASKPFELPAADPDYHRQLLKSYNVPELMYGPVSITPQQFARILKNK